MRKSTKKIGMLACAVIAAMSLTACGGGKGAKNIDVAKVADDLNSSVITTDTLTEAQSNMLSSIYFFEDGEVASGKVYMSANATADEICVIECADEKAAESVSSKMQARVDNQAALFETYNADEAAKLKDAIVKTSGKYAVMVVCDDYDKAQSILKDAGF